MHRFSREARRRWLSSSSSFSSKPIPTTEIQAQPSQNINSHDHQLEIANAIRPSYQPQTPLLIPKLISKCDAIYFWRSLDYWRAAVPNNMPVDVELGSYNSGNKVSLEFGDYLNYLSKSIEEDEQHQEQTAEPVAYLAQNELFTEVQRDVPIPQFCSEQSFNVGEGKLYHSMLWLGPRNTVSPLHYDPLDNLLMQIVGTKRVLLYPPDKSNVSDNNPGWHYAGFNGNQYNTSDVDVEHPNLEKHPNFQTAPTPYECVIGPGDVLYIPAKWWHHVRSLSWSASANVWWR
jgi:lysine-specific demethylase 8